MILTKMKKIAEDYLGSDVTDAVITVPAFFSDAAKSAAARKIDNTFFLIVLSPVNHLQNKLKFIFLDDNIT